MSDRSLKFGMPYARARSMGGGSLLCFSFYATEAEAHAEIAAAKERLKNEKGKLPEQFVVYFPHLSTKPANRLATFIGKLSRRERFTLRSMKTKALWLSLIALMAVAPSVIYADVVPQTSMQDATQRTCKTAHGQPVPCPRPGPTDPWPPPVQIGQFEGILPESTLVSQFWIFGADPDATCTCFANGGMLGGCLGSDGHGHLCVKH